MPRCLPAPSVIVVDNASHDETRAAVTSRGVCLIANEENRGFAAAVNQGIRALDTPYILLLNPDSRPANGPGTAARLLRPARRRGRRRQTSRRCRPSAGRIHVPPIPDADGSDLRGAGLESPLAAQSRELAIPLLRL